MLEPEPDSSFGKEGEGRGKPPVLSWLESGLQGELPPCGEELTPGEHLRYWLLPAYSNQMNPEIGRAWHRAALEASQDGGSGTGIQSSELPASLRRAVN